MVAAAKTPGPQVDMPGYIRMTDAETAAENAGIGQSAVMRAAFLEKRVSVEHENGTTYLKIADLVGIYPQIEAHLTDSSASQSSQAGQASTAVEANADRSEQASPSKSEGSTPQDTPESADVSLNFRLGDGRYSLVTRGGSVTPSSRGKRDRGGQSNASVPVYHKRPAPQSIKRLEEQHKAELDKRDRDHQQELEQLRQHYEGQLSRLHQEIETRDSRIERLRAENDSLRKASASTNQHTPQASEEVSRLRGLLDEANDRARRLLYEVSVLRDLNEEHRKRIRRVSRERDRAENARIYERESAVQERNLLLRIIEQMTEERSKRVRGRREALMQRFKAELARPYEQARAIVTSTSHE